MGARSAPPEPFDGSSGNPLARTEPKVRAAAIAATVTPALLWLIHTYVPGAAVLPAQLEALVGVAVTGAVTWAAGYLARTVDRIDLFAPEPAASSVPPAPLVVPDTSALAAAVVEEVLARLAVLPPPVAGVGPVTTEIPRVTQVQTGVPPVPRSGS